MSKIENPRGFITGSIDKHVKVWSYLGEEWCDLILIGENPIRKWSFPFNWEEAKETDKKDILLLINKLDPEEVKNECNIVFEEEETKNIHKVKSHMEDNVNMKINNLNLVGRYKKKAKKIIDELEKGNIERINEEGNKKKKVIIEEPEAPLAQDVGALIDIYKDSSKEKRRELIASMSDLKQTLCNFNS